MGIWSFRQEAWAWTPCLVVVLGHNNMKWWWRLYDLKGHSSASNHSQTFRYSKISLVSKKRTFIGWKLLCWHWLCIRIILGLFIAIIDGLTKNRVGKSCCLLWCVPVHCSLDCSLHFMLGDRESSVTPIGVCQNWNPTVTVARQDFEKCCLRPHALDWNTCVFLMHDIPGYSNLILGV